MSATGLLTQKKPCATGLLTQKKAMRNWSTDPSNASAQYWYTKRNMCRLKFNQNLQLPIFLNEDLNLNLLKYIFNSGTRTKTE